MQIVRYLMINKTSIFIFAIWATCFSIAAYATEENQWTLDRLSERGLFAITLQPKDDRPIIGDYHEWVIRVRDENGKGIEGAEFRFDGGMAAHGHGLPSQPLVTQYLGEGKYLIEGILFNMAGAWTLVIAIKNDNMIDTAQFDMTLDF